MRLLQTHVCPVLRNFDVIAPATAESKSASSKTINGALPPNSIETFFIVSAQLRVRILPIAVEPVKESFRTIGLSVSAVPISLALVPTTTLRTPFGMPAWSASSANAKADSGVSEAGLITTGQPAASAGAHFLVIMAIGKFHGVIAATTPIGCLITRILRSFAGVGMTSP